MDHTNISSDSTNGDIFLKTPFSWPKSMSNEIEETNVASQGVESSQLEERKMYIGYRRSCAQHEVMEDLYRGS